MDAGDISVQLTEERDALALRVHRARVAAAAADQPLWIDGLPCCRDCGEGIASRRQVQPTASRCVPCQQNHERRAARGE